jgi:iron complex transport system substrate-binding protein
VLGAGADRIASLQSLLSAGMGQGEATLAYLDTARVQAEVGAAATPLRAVDLSALERQLRAALAGLAPFTGTDFARLPALQLPNREPNLEALLLARPDVVLTLHRDSVELLEAAGMPVVFLAWREPEDVKSCITLLGEVFGKPATALRYRQWFDATLAGVARTLTGLASQARPRVLYLQPETLTQPRLIAEWWIAAAGGASVTDDGRRAETRSFSLEQVLRWDPEVLIVTSPQARALVLSDRRFGALKALRDGRVHVAPTGAHSWANRTAEQPLTVLWAARLFHPTRFAALDLAAAARAFYREFFGCVLTGEQLAEILGGSL